LQARASAGSFLCFAFTKVEVFKRSFFCVYFYVIIHHKMKKKVYIETTIISYLTVRFSRDIVIAARQEVTNEYWGGLLNSFDCI